MVTGPAHVRSENYLPCLSVFSRLPSPFFFVAFIIKFSSHGAWEQSFERSSQVVRSNRCNFLKYTIKEPV